MSEVIPPRPLAEIRATGKSVPSRQIDAVRRFLASPRGRWWILFALALYAVIGFFVWIRRAGDFAGYLVVGELVLANRHLYIGPDTAPNTWPPFFSLLCVPLALLARLSPYLARGLWLCLNFLCLWWALSAIARLVYGRRLRWSSEAFSLAAPPMLVPFLITDRFTSSNFDHLQINIVLFALTLAGLIAIRSGRWFAGGAAVGFAAAVKVMPVVFLPYLLWRREWRGFWAASVTAAVCSLSPVLVFGPQRFWEYVIAWREKVAAGWGVGKMNQSVWAMWDRWLGHGMVPFGTPGVNDVPESGSPMVTAAVVGTVLAFALLAWRRWRHRPQGAWQTAAEWSVVFAASALCSPVTWKAYLVVLLLPHTLLFAAYQHSEPASRIRRLTGATLLLAASANFFSPGFLGRDWAGRLEMASVVTIIAGITTAVVIWLWPYFPELERRARQGQG